MTSAMNSTKIQIYIWRESVFCFVFFLSRKVHKESGWGTVNLCKSPYRYGYLEAKWLPLGLGVQVPVCVEFACSACASGVSSRYFGFLPQSSNMCYGLIGMQL